MGEKGGGERRLVLPRFWCRFAIRRSSFLAGDPMSTVIMAMVMCVGEDEWILQWEGEGGCDRGGKERKRERRVGRKRRKEIKRWRKKKI